MAEPIKISDFSSGWIPSDDKHAGRKTGLLRMTGVTLDENGALVLANGTAKGSFAYPSNAHTLFSKFVCGSRKNYLALADGSVYRDSTAIIAAAAGSVTRAGFGVYGDFVLIFSGASRIKDGCDGAVSLAGLVAPQQDPLFNVLAEAFYEGTAIHGSLSNFLHNYNGYAGTFDIISATEYRVDIGNDSGVEKISYDVNAGSPDFPKDLSGSDEDTFSFQITSDNIEQINSINLSFGLDYNAPSNPPPSPVGTTSFFSNAFNYAWSKSQIAAATIGKTAILSCKRSDFVLQGGGIADWTAIQGFATGVAIPPNITGAFINYSNFKITGGGNINGTYEYVQVNVYNTANYTSLSSLGPISPATQISHAQVEYIPEDPTPYDQTANEVWIYRKGGNLPRFYRVARIKVDELAPFYDNLTEDEVIQLGVAYFPLLSVNSTDLPEDIIEVAGPINGRMLYFSSSKVYFSEVYSPENYNPRHTMQIAGDDAELLKFARKVDDNLVIIGTTRDLYTLTGSFRTFPDGSLDVSLRSLGVDKPPITQDVVVYKKGLIYFAAMGWVYMLTNGDYSSFTAPNTDILYEGRARYEYGGVPTPSIFSTARFACTLNREKFFCVVPEIVSLSDPGNESLWTKRMEIFDFTRKYWRVTNYAPDLLTVSDDGVIYGFFNSTKRLNQMDYPFSKLLNKV